MKIENDSVWEHFRTKIDELFEAGYNLPQTLQITAVYQVDERLSLWKDKLGTDDFNARTQQESLQGDTDNIRHSSTATKRSPDSGTNMHDVNVNENFNCDVGKDEYYDGDDGMPTNTDPVTMVTEENKHQDETTCNDVEIKPEKRKRTSTKTGRIRNSSSKRKGPYSCKHCTKTYLSRASIMIHEKLHLTGPLHCPHCDKVFRSKLGLDQHVPIHTHGLVCTECRYTSRSQCALDTHMENMHKNKRKKLLICEVCGASFVRKACLQRHSLVHSRLKAYTCLQCDFKTHGKHILRSHVRNVHETREHFICTICGAMLKHQGSLLEHQKKHVNRSDTYQCDQCSRKCATLKALGDHKKTHRDPDIPCDICGKVFKFRHRLKRHMIIHTGKKEHSCPYCSYQCNLHCNLRKHTKTVHKQNLAVKT